MSDSAEFTQHGFSSVTKVWLAVLFVAFVAGTIGAFALMLVGGVL